MSDWRVLKPSNFSKRVRGKLLFPCQCCGSLRRKARSLSKALWRSFLKKNIFLHYKNHRFCIDCTKNLEESKLDLKIATKDDLKEILGVLKSHVLKVGPRSEVCAFKKSDVPPVITLPCPRWKIRYSNIINFFRKKMRRKHLQRKKKCRIFPCLWRKWVCMWLVGLDFSECVRMGECGWVGVDEWVWVGGWDGVDVKKYWRILNKKLVKPCLCYCVMQSKKKGSLSTFRPKSWWRSWPWLQSLSKKATKRKENWWCKTLVSVFFKLLSHNVV